MTETERRATTTDAGIPVESDEHSLTLGAGGPILLQDHYLIEQMAQFNRERIPERQPHAKGGGAFGRFEVTHDVSAYTKAALFQPGTRTDLLIRFSTVAGERGSPDTWRDPRGFAVKFYTTEGNYDMVGNNTPVFFVKDPMKFQHFIRSQKRRADTNLRDHDMQWDFWTLSPESAHQVTWLMGDRGIPRTWRHMNGYSSHTYMWVNAAGEKFWVKYHFKTDQGVEFFTQDEGDQMAAVDTDYHTRDLYEHIARRRVPELVAQDADHAVRRCDELPLQSVRSHQGVATLGLSADRRRPNDAGSQSHGLPQRDRAGGIPTEQHGSRNRSQSRPDAARTVVLLRRCTPLSDRHQLSATAGERPEVTGAQLQQGRGDAIRQRVRPGVRARTPTAGRPLTPPATASRQAGPPTATWCGPAMCSTPRTTIGVKPERWSGTCWTMRPGSGWWTTSPGTC